MKPALRLRQLQRVPRPTETIEEMEDVAARAVTLLML